MKRRQLLGVASVFAAGCASACAGGGGVEGNPAAAWSKRAGLTVPRDDFGFTALSGRLYAIAGMTGERGNALDSVEVYDPVANVWSRGPRLPAPAASLRAVALNERVYVAGGARQNEETGFGWALDFKAAAWNTIAPLVESRFGHGLAALDGRLYAAGGLRGGEAVSSMEVYDPLKDRWEGAAPLPEARFNCALVAASRHLYCIGGIGPDRTASAATFVFDPVQGGWKDGPALPSPMSNFGAAVDERGAIHVLLHRLHYILSTGNQEWAERTRMPTSRHGLGLSLLGGKLYAAGGCSEDPQYDLPTLEVYAPAS